MQYLLVGLGNPGSQYQYTRHNAGFMVADALCARWGAQWQAWQNQGEYAKVAVQGREVFIAKPSTFMNLSGQMVCSLARFFKIEPQNTLVCFDDVSLDLGHIRLRKNGSAGGQKGMKSVIECWGTQDIARLRVGVGPKPERFDLADYVLSKFQKTETAVLEEALSVATEAAEMWLTHGIEKAMNRYNAAPTK